MIVTFYLEGRQKVMTSVSVVECFKKFLNEFTEAVPEVKGCKINGVKTIAKLAPEHTKTILVELSKKQVDKDFINVINKLV